MVRRSKHSLRRNRQAPGATKASPGSAPGVLRSLPQAYESKLYVIGYSAEGIEEKECQSVDEVAAFLTRWPVVWINMVGLADIAMLERLGEMFGLERLLLEDVLDTSARPKVEFYEQYVFAILKGGVQGEQISSEQISFFLKNGVVLVFEEKPERCFTQVRERIRRSIGRIRSMNADYLLYALMDEVIDRYFPLLDQLNYQLAKIEDEIVTEEKGLRDRDVIHQIHHAKNDLLLLHRIVWPMNDVIGNMLREDTPLISKTVRTYLRDCHDHCMQMSELTQFYRDTAVGLLNTFLAYEGHKTNEIVKVLTMISAVFIPLNFIAGVYGMNFRGDASPWNMPELSWTYGYPFALGTMGIVALFMLFYFRYKGWTLRSKPAFLG